MMVLLERARYKRSIREVKSRRTISTYVSEACLLIIIHQAHSSTTDTLLFFKALIRYCTVELLIRLT